LAGERSRARTRDRTGVIVASGASIRVRELPPEISQKPRAHISDNTFDLQAQERAMIERALQRFRGIATTPPKR